MARSLLDIIHSVPPERLAVSDRSCQHNYASLCDQVEIAAGYFRHRYGKGRCIVLKAQPEVSFVEALIGVMLSGNTVVPVDPALPQTSLEYILQKCGGDAALDPNETMTSARSLNQRFWESSVNDGMAMVMFTSGTTGTPKGVVMTHRNLAHSWFAVSEYLELASHPSTVSILPLHYSYGLISQVLCMLWNGGYVHLLPGLRNPLAFFDVVVENNIETFCGVPSTFSLLARFHHIRPICLPTMKVICSAGAGFDLNLYPTIKEIFPNAVVFNNYGMTEACPRISYVSDRSPEFFQGSCGSPILGMELVTLDPDTFHVLPDGEEGVLGIKGPNVMRGYLNDEERTSRSFQQDGFLVSGDVAYIKNAHLYLRGRLDDMFNVGGEKVAPAEIERVLLQVPGIEGVAVKGVHDATRGQVAVAFLVLSRQLRKRELDEFLQDRLVAAKVPYRYYEVGELPMTSSGKIQRAMIDENSESVVRAIN